MDREAWQATVHGVARVGHDTVTKPPPPHSVDVVYYIDRFYVEPLWHFWGKSHSVMAYNSLNMLIDLFC